MTRDEAISRLHNIMGFDYHYLPADDAEAMDMAIEALEQPEIIRCKECALCKEVGAGLFYCDSEDILPIGSYVPPEGFCYFARRREE